MTRKKAIRDVACPVCAHPKHSEITRLLSADPNCVLYVVAEYSVTLEQVMVHCRTCMRGTAISMAARLMLAVEKVIAAAEQLLLMKKPGLDPLGLRSVVQSLDAGQKIQERALKLTGQLATQVDVVRSPLFKAAIRALIDSFDDMPEVQDRIEVVMRRFAGESED